MTRRLGSVEAVAGVRRYSIRCERFAIAMELCRIYRDDFLEDVRPPEFRSEGVLVTIVNPPQVNGVVKISGVGRVGIAFQEPIGPCESNHAWASFGILPNGCPEKIYFPPTKPFCLRCQIGTAWLPIEGFHEWDYMELIPAAAVLEAALPAGDLEVP